jgi:HD superfamily phosphohydrolase
MTKQYQIRCPIHGLIPMNAWERKLIDSSVFQRLRRIRQLAWTDYVYPGAMHTRFEHSIGVMHVASLLFDNVVGNSSDVLSDLYGGSSDWVPRERQKVRLAALLHDVGHSPFSHASEELFPETDGSAVRGIGFLFPDQALPRRRFKHEEYSIALIKGPLRAEIESDDLNHGFRITAEEIADLLQGGAGAGPTLLWREILSNQLDADRMDYLLRDSHHLGVSYGKYDLHRLISSVCAFRHQSNRDTQARVRIGVLRGGLHAAESLIIAR